MIPCAHIKIPVSTEQRIIVRHVFRNDVPASLRDRAKDFHEKRLGGLVRDHVHHLASFDPLSLAQRKIHEDVRVALKNFFARPIHGSPIISRHPTSRHLAKWMHPQVLGACLVSFGHAHAVKWGHAQNIPQRRESVRKKTRPRKIDPYDAFCGVLYVLKSGCRWRMVPSDFPAGSTIYWYFRIWSESTEGRPSTLGQALKKMVGGERSSHGRNISTSFVIVDARSVKNTDTAEEKGCDAGKKVSGIKCRIAVDTNGLPHGITVTTANAPTGTGPLPLRRGAGRTSPTPKASSSTADARERSSRTR